MSWVDLRLRRSRSAVGDLVVRFGVSQLDGYLEFLAVRSRPNTVTAVAYDLKVFFTVVGKAPAEVVAADVLSFVTAQ
jgi:integrase/recombinase XerD